MARTLWLIKLNDQPIGRFWAPVTHSEYDVLQELKAQGYDPNITVTLGEWEETVQTIAQQAMAQL